MTLVELLQSRGLQPRKISVNHGGEYACSCPVCGDGGRGAKSDRFHVWPERETSGLCAGRFWCRRCGISGDTIGFLQKVDSLSFQDACAELGVVLQQRGAPRSRRYVSAPVVKAPMARWQPTQYPDPCETWQLKAGNLLADCQARLMADTTALQWLAERGITAEMAAAYGLGYNRSSKDGDRYRPRSAWGLPEKLNNGKPKKLWIPQGWVIPCYNDQGHLLQLRIRRRNEDVAKFGGHIKYLPIDGSSQATMVLHPGVEVFVVVESGFDATVLAAIGGGRIGAITAWNSSARPDHRAHALLSGCGCILGGLDYDQGGDGEQQWWQDTYSHYRRLAPLPGGAKDPGDAYAAGATHEALRQWLFAGLPKGLRIKFGMERVAPPLAPKKTAVQPPPDEEEVTIITLTNGLEIFVTNSQDKWAELSEQGLPVFSQNELDRLKAATATMDQEDRLAAAMKVVEVKQELGGYVRAGRALS